MNTNDLRVSFSLRPGGVPELALEVDEPGEMPRRYPLTSELARQLASSLYSGSAAHDAAAACVARIGRGRAASTDMNTRPVHPVTHFRDPFRLRLRQFICHAFGHVPKANGPYWDCGRCYDVLPQGNRKRQP